MKAFTYTIFDANPSESGNVSWPSHCNVAVEAETADDALEIALGEARENSEDYDKGHELFALVWDARGKVVAEGSWVKGGAQ